MTKNEKTLLQPYYKELVSVSLYGNYGPGHTTGVDVCDLVRYPDSSFAAVFSILLFDYVIELPRALAECRRVLHDSGIFITSVAPYRLLDGRAPLTHKAIEKRPDYFSYIPDGAQLPSIKVGRETFLDLMESAGLRATHLRVADQQSGAFSEWFIGHPKTRHTSREEREAGVTRSKPPPQQAPQYGSMSKEPALEEQLAEAERLWAAPFHSLGRERSVTLFRELAERHALPLAIYRMGCAYRYGVAVERDWEKALRWLSHQSITNWRSALLIKGTILATKGFAGFDPEKARQLLLEARAQGLAAEADPILARLEADATFTPDYIRSARRNPNCLARGVVAAVYETCCTLCGFSFERVSRVVADCPACRGAPRTRTFPLFFHQYLRPWLAASGPLPDLPLLAFAMVREEEQVLSLRFPEIRSVSLYANYRGDHQAGVDARDLSRFGDACFSGSFSILTWDFFTEQEQAIGEAARTIAPGGVFLHQLSTARVVTGDMPPRTVESVRKSATYYSYLPDDHSLVSIKVGIDWYIKALERGGFKACHVNFPDPHSGESNHWFIGRRCRP